MIKHNLDFSIVMMPGTLGVVEYMLQYESPSLVEGKKIEPKMVAVISTDFKNGDTGVIYEIKDRTIGMYTLKSFNRDLFKTTEWFSFEEIFKLADECFKESSTDEVIFHHASFGTYNIFCETFDDRAIIELNGLPFYIGDILGVDPMIYKGPGYLFAIGSNEPTYDEIMDMDVNKLSESEILNRKTDMAVLIGHFTNDETSPYFNVGKTLFEQNKKYDGKLSKMFDRKLTTQYQLEVHRNGLR